MGLMIDEVCPQFRTLVIGKCGAGKSSLINNAFDVTDALVSHVEPGKADIDHEILSKDNGRFLLHDSLGFEHGEKDTVDIVRTFIQCRSRKAQIQDRIHAIWLCVNIPTTGGRLTETGVEELLELRTEKELEHVPIIVIFTKYDRLVDTERLAMKKEGLETTIGSAEERANKRLQEECILPLEARVGKSIPYVPVSTKARYKPTLNQLIEVTLHQAEGYVSGAGTRGRSQKLDASVRTRASIAG